MALQQAVGIAFAVSTRLPASDTISSFSGLSPWVDVGDLNEIPDLTGEYDIATFDNLTTGEETKFSDVHRAGEGEIKLGYDLTDTGQTALETAAATGASMSLRFTLKSGVKYYRKAIIKSFKPTDATTGNVLMATVMVAFFGRAVKAPATTPTPTPTPTGG